MQKFALWLSRLRTPLVSLRMWVQSLASVIGLRIQHCCELQYRSQMWLRSLVAVAMAQAHNCSSHSTPSSRTSICCRCSPKKKKKNTCTPIFMASLFIIAKTWKQLKCPETDEWIKKMGIQTHTHTYTMEYYSAIKVSKYCHLLQHGQP